MTHSIKKFLTSFFEQHNNWQSDLLMAWPSIVGDLKEHVHVEKIYKNTIFVGVHNPCLMHELHLLSDVFIKAINQKLNAPHIKSIRFKNIVPIKKQQKKMPVARKEQSSHERLLSLKEQNALAVINDHELQQVLKQFLMRCSTE